MKNVIELFNNYQDDTAIFVLSIAAIIYLLSKAGKGHRTNVIYCNHGSGCASV